MHCWIWNKQMNFFVLYFADLQKRTIFTKHEKPNGKECKLSKYFRSANNQKVEKKTTTQTEAPNENLYPNIFINLLRTGSLVLLCFCFFSVFIFTASLSRNFSRTIFFSFCLAIKWKLVFRIVEREPLLSRA